MAGGYYTALSGMRTRMDALDRLAADIANASTAGYKTERAGTTQADRPSFGAALQSAVDVANGADTHDPHSLPRVEGWEAGLGSHLDDIMDSMDEVVDQILVYEVKVLPPELSDQVAVLQRCAELTAAAMPKLQSMSKLGDYWIEINRLENQGDKNHRRILAKLSLRDRVQLVVFAHDHRLV